MKVSVSSGKSEVGAGQARTKTESDNGILQLSITLVTQEIAPRLGLNRWCATLDSPPVRAPLACLNGLK